MGLFIRRQSYRRAHDLAIFCNTLNQWRDDQERYWQHGSRMSNTLLSAKQSTGNLSQPAAEDARRLADVQDKGLQAVSHQPSTFTELCASASRLKPIFCEISEAPQPLPPPLTSLVSQHVKPNLSPNMSTLTEMSFSYGIFSTKKEDRNHFSL